MELCGEISRLGVIKPKYMDHQSGNVPLALSERQSDLRRIRVAPPFLSVPMEESKGR